jgi:hypothetical protein
MKEITRRDVLRLSGSLGATGLLAACTHARLR